MRLFFILLALFSSAKPGDIESLWKKYEEAVSKDLPAEQISILSEIQKTASAQHRAWDFYEACDKYVAAKTRINWKERQNLLKEFEKKIMDFGEPVAIFYFKQHQYGTNELKDFVTKNADALKASYNPRFHEADWRIGSYKFGSALKKLFSNDYDYVLWSIGGKETLLNYYGDSQPFGVLAGYLAATESNESLKVYADRFKGTPYGLLAEDELLQRRLNGKELSSDGYLKLRDDCKDLIRRRDSFSGPDKDIAACCNSPEGIIETLESEHIGFTGKDGRITLSLRNIPSVNVSIFDSEKREVFKKTLANPHKSFFRPDTLILEMPWIDDGDYTTRASYGKTECSSEYLKSTISGSARIDAQGPAVFFADYLTGEPIGKVDLQVLRKDEIIATLNGFTLSDGFTLLPSDLADWGSRDLKIQCTTGSKGNFRRSRRISIRKPYGNDLNDNHSDIHANVLTDRGAYSPDDTVKFKVITWTGTYSLRCGTAGTHLHARLFDAEHKKIAEKELTTGAMGSAAGEFGLERKARNGIYTIELFNDKNTRLISQSVRVDDFILPTFDVVFNGPFEFSAPVDSVCISGRATSYSGRPLTEAKARLDATGYGKSIFSGPLKINPDGSFKVRVPIKADGGWLYYDVRLSISDSTGESQEFRSHISIYAPSENESPTTYDFEELDGISLRIIGGDQPVWAAVELFGADNSRLEHSLIHFSPKGKSPAETIVSYPFKDSYPASVALKVLYFQNGRYYSKTLERRRPDLRYEMPLKADRFTNATKPESFYTLSFSTAPYAECAAAIFDKSTERIMPCIWRPLRVTPFPSPQISYSSSCGQDRTQAHVMYARSMAAKANGAAMLMSDAVEESIPFQMATSNSDFSAESADVSVPVRENFANTLAWLPFLQSDANGKLEFSFKTAGKLSTYCVQIFAFDSQMRNEVLKKDFIVTLPVQVSVIETPQLYCGDSLSVAAVFSSTVEKATPGTASIIFYDGADYRAAKEIGRKSERLTIPAKGSIRLHSGIRTAATGALGVKVSFIPDDRSDGADAMFQSIPVLAAEQTITEAHSSLLKAGEDDAALEKLLRSEFTGIDGTDAIRRDISIAQMLAEAVPAQLSSNSDNAVELSKVLLADSLSRKIGGGGLSQQDKASALEKLHACQCEDGGFAWFKGMEPSQIITALVLERKAGLDRQTIEAAVKYLDKSRFEKEKRPYWCGWISLGQYLRIRSMYAEVPFSTEGIDSKTLKEFRKDVKDYLTPKKERGLNGRILEKTRRILTLRALCGSADGQKLAAAWKISTGRMAKSQSADIESLLQYAVEHKSGGMYFPNAVMPWRGLLESELYAHNLLCELLSGLEDERAAKTADDIRLWIMVQKETQQWDSDPAFIEALCQVFSGSKDLLQTKVMALQARYTKPFSEIRPAANGISITRQEGSTGPLKVGEKVKVSWKISNEENRSFVHLSLTYCAALQPTSQLSGHTWNGYRSVGKGSIEYWFDTYPEGDSTITEEFFVSREGEFQTPAAIVESLYAPHYRANTESIKTNTLQQ